MKKLLFAVILSFIVFTSSCGNVNETAEIMSVPVCITAALSGSQGSFTANITETDCKIIFDESHPLSGTEIYFGIDGNTVAVGDFKRNVDSGIFPAQEAFVKAIRTLSENQNSGSATENGIKYAIDEMTIMVYYDKDTETITGIGTEENGRSFQFNIVAVNPYEAQSNSVG